MDYNLDSLGTRNFERLTQALLAKLIGPKLVVFGDGPDGGREATWRGAVASFGIAARWEGYGVIQAKFRANPGDPSDNLAWLKKTVRAEVLDWVKEGSNRIEKPDFLIFATNVRLSSVPDNGKDEINSYISKLLKKEKLALKDFRVLDYYDLSVSLDDADAIRRRYAAFVTSGDIIARLVDDSTKFERAFGQAILAYTARCLKDDDRLNLTQAGTAGDGQVTMGDVFVDLPADVPLEAWLQSARSGFEVQEDSDIDDDLQALPENIELRPGVVQHLVDTFNRTAEITKKLPEGVPHPHRTVLIGGPGQGKSTITQWLAQIYRAEFLRETTISAHYDIRTIVKKTEKRRQVLGLPDVRARRWPIRIVLTELADYLAKEPSASLLHYIAAKISDRSSYGIDSTALRNWLETYPWLVLIDGLDEVPASSNRAQVMESIRDFFLDVAALEGDVAAVATTRPQGYSEEFSQEEYRHIQLSNLTVEESLAYANGLVAVRMGDGTTAANKVVDRLARASQEEHTKKLFETPLQVTILEVLLEKLGKAPSDRSRLFSAYYSVISQREQEKSGALSDLLQKYESDVDYLHRRIGFELQERGSLVGENTSYLTAEEFNSYIVERFEEQGHTHEEVAVLSKSFSKLVTDRLVFLAKLQADRIGFELRSLQEFMAGEYVVNRAEKDVIPELQRIATSSYWRNVVLFAVGSIFAHREHLRAEVVILCVELNGDPKASNVILPGAELALDILRDGSCLSMPRYARSLYINALCFLELPGGVEINKLRFLAETDLSEMLWEKIDILDPMHVAQLLNGVRLLSSLSQDEGDRAGVALSRLIHAVGPEARKHLIEWAWDTQDSRVSKLLEDHFMDCPPETFRGTTSGRRRRAIRSDEPAPAEWVRNLGKLTSRKHASLMFRSKGVVGTDVERTDGMLWATYKPLGEDLEAWTWLTNVNSEAAEWRAIKGLAWFALEPTAESLANALELAGKAATLFYPHAAPWPYVACIRFAQDRCRQDEFSASGVLLELAESCRRGDFGDGKIWHAVQERWPSAIEVSDDFISASQKEFESQPFPSFIKNHGFVPRAYNYTIRSVQEEESSVSMGMIRLLAERGTPGSLWADLALFVAEFMRRIEDVSFVPLEDSRRLAKLAVDLPGNESMRQRIGWIELISAADFESMVPYIRAIATSSWLSGSTSEDTSRVLLSRATKTREDSPLARIALHSTPSLLLSLDGEAMAKKWVKQEPVIDTTLILAYEIFTCSPNDLWAGVFDSRMRDLAEVTDSSFGPGWFTNLLAEQATPMSRDIAARGALLLGKDYPYLAEQWLGIAKKQHKAVTEPSIAD